MSKQNNIQNIGKHYDFLITCAENQGYTVTKTEIGGKIKCETPEGELHFIGTIAELENWLLDLPLDKKASFEGGIPSPEQVRTVLFKVGTGRRATKQKFTLKHALIVLAICVVFWGCVIFTAASIWRAVFS